ncbi:MAG: hypothetical protein PHQ83_08170, partial [Eubacteriales bacterium]|nr:hypothetical protein [Eubacteriales bacterium]
MKRHLSNDPDNLACKTCAGLCSWSTVKSLFVLVYWMAGDAQCLKIYYLQSKEESWKPPEPSRLFS